MRMACAYASNRASGMQQSDDAPTNEHDACACANASSIWRSEPQPHSIVFSAEMSSRKGTTARARARARGAGKYTGGLKNA